MVIFWFVLLPWFYQESWMKPKALPTWDAVIAGLDDRHAALPASNLVERILVIPELLHGLLRKVARVLARHVVRRERREGDTRWRGVKPTHVLVLRRSPAARRVSRSVRGRGRDDGAAVRRGRWVRADGGKVESGWQVEAGIRGRWCWTGGADGGRGGARNLVSQAARLAAVRGTGRALPVAGEAVVWGPLDGHCVDCFCV